MKTISLNIKISKFLNWKIMNPKAWPTDLKQYINKNFNQGVYTGMSSEEKSIVLDIVLMDDTEKIDISYLWIDQDDLCLMGKSTSIVIPRHRIKSFKVRIEA